MYLLTVLLKPLAYLSLPIFLLHTASNYSSLCRYYIRLCIYLSSLSICSVWGVLVSIGMTLIGRRLDINWVTARSFYAIAGRALNIQFEVEGEEHLKLPGPSVLMGNHQSMLDILYLGRIFPKRASILSKKELQWMPFLGQYMMLSGAIFVDRGNNAKAVKSLTMAGQTMKARGTSLWVFPEGTRSNTKNPDLLPFKKGGFHLAVQAGIPVIPIVCENYWRLYHKGILESGLLKIKVLPPISTTGLTALDVPELSTKVQEQMLTALRKISNTGIAEAEKPTIPEVEIASDYLSSTRCTTNSSLRSAVAPRDEVSSSSESQIFLEHTSPAVVVKYEENDKGADTEEDEGMVLVGRPN